MFVYVLYRNKKGKKRGTAGPRENVRIFFEEHLAELSCKILNDTDPEYMYTYYKAKCEEV